MDSNSSQETFIEHLLCSRTWSIDTGDMAENKREVHRQRVDILVREQVKCRAR